jgi:hypothetical protein
LEGAATVVFLVTHRFPRRGITLRAGRSLHSIPAVLVQPEVEILDMITLAIWSCRFLIVVAFVDVLFMVTIMLGRFCALNDSKYSRITDGPGNDPH